MTHDSQRIQIQRFMAQGRSITPLICYKLCGSLNLCQRIREIEKHFTVESRWVHVGKARVKEYWMPEARERARALCAA